MFVLLLTFLACVFAVELWTNEVLFSEEIFTHIDCFYDERPVCQVACNAACIHQGFPLNARSPLPCLSELPTGCEVKVFGHIEQANTGCNKVKFQQKTQDFTGIILPFHYDNWDLPNQVLRAFYLLVRTTPDWWDDNTETAGDFCQFEYAQVSLTDQCMFDLRRTVLLNPDMGIDYDHRWFTVDLTVPFVSELSTTASASGDTKYISFVEPHGQDESCLLPTLSQVALSAEDGVYFGTRMEWYRILKSLNEDRAWPMARAESDCGSSESCQACEAVEECAWCMTPSGQTCSAECLENESELIRRLSCGSSTRLVLIPLYIMLLWVVYYL